MTVTRESCETMLREQWAEGRRQILSPSWESFARTHVAESPWMLRGGLTWWEPSCRTTWIDPEQTEEWVSADEPWTMHDLSRRWLRRTVGGHRCGCFNPDDYLYKLPQPAYYKGGKILSDDCAYVDIDRAFYQLFAGRTYDPGVNVKSTRVVIIPGLIDLDPAEMAWFSHDSRARNSIVGIARMRYQYVSRFGELDRRVHYANTNAPGLWATIALTLNSIAREAVDWYGALYVMTDGFILPGDAARPFQEHLAERWGLTSRVTGRGRTTITGLGRYRVGGYRSARLGTGAGAPDDALVTMDRDQRDSLARWARRSS